MQAPENAMFHRHLVLAYGFTWATQLLYLGYVVKRRLSGEKGLPVSHRGPAQD